MLLGSDSDDETIPAELAGDFWPRTIVKIAEAPGIQLSDQSVSVFERVGDRLANLLLETHKLFREVPRAWRASSDFALFQPVRRVFFQDDRTLALPPLAEWIREAGQRIRHHLVAVNFTDPGVIHGPLGHPLNFKHLHHLVPQMIDHLHRNPP